MHNPREYLDKYGKTRHEFYILVLDTDDKITKENASDFPCDKSNYEFQGEGSLPKDYSDYEKKATDTYIFNRDNFLVSVESPEVKYLKEIGIVDSKSTAKTVYELKSTDVKTTITAVK